eukprot:12910099-Prorocentrum_lima.AAC.1
MQPVGQRREWCIANLLVVDFPLPLKDGGMVDMAAARVSLSLSLYQCPSLVIIAQQSAVPVAECGGAEASGGWR